MFTLKPQKDYSLIDAGEGLKLERYGEYVIQRPDPQALWPKKTKWTDVDAVFSKNNTSDNRGVFQAGSDDSEIGNWVKTRSIPERWPITFVMGDDLPNLKIYARLTPFKHTGIFPEQFSNWKWSMEIIKKALSGAREVGKGDNKHAEKFTQENPPKILNLFGYSGGATVACLLAGAHVTHVDSSKGAMNWANENAVLAEVSDKPVRWILEDAVSFVKKEIRRGNKYDGIILDPPAFGRGAKGEVWKIERDFLPFLELVYQLLKDDALFLIVNGYAAGYSSIAYAQNLNMLVDKMGGEVEHGELCLEAEPSSNKKELILPCGIVARWKGII